MHAHLYLCISRAHTQRGRGREGAWELADRESGATGERNHDRKSGNMISVEDTEALTEASAELDKPLNPFIKGACGLLPEQVQQE